jgi:hypothetical protein
MKSLLRMLLLAILLLGAACSSYEWREYRSGPTTQAEVYDAIDYLARTDGFGPSTECDRGLAIWVSRWRVQQIGLGRPGRLKLRVEILLEESDPKEGFFVRYRIERQTVEDLGKSLEPEEDDWEDDGQDTEREALFGERLRRKLSNVTFDTKKTELPDIRSGR